MNQEISVKNIVQLIARFSVATWLSAIINFFTVPLLTRLLEPSLLGRLNLFITTVNVLVSFISMGTFDGFIRFFFEYDLNSDLLKEMGGLVIKVGFVASVVLYIFIHMKVSFMLYIMIVIAYLLKYALIYYRNINNIKKYTLVFLCQNTFVRSFIVLPAFFINDFSLALFVSIFILGIITICLYIELLKTIKFKIKDMSLHMNMLKFSILAWPNSIVVYANPFITQLLIKKYMDENFLGIYASTAFFTAILNLIQSGFQNFWGPFMYKYYKTEQVKIKKIHNYLSVILVTITAMIILFRSILYVLIGKEYYEGINIMAFIIVNAVIVTLGETTAYGISIEKKSYLLTISMYIMFISNVILSNLFIPKYGLFGAGLSGMFSTVIYFVSVTYTGQKLYSSIESYFKTISTLCTLVILALLNYFLSENPILLYSLIILILLSYYILFWKDLKQIKFALIKNED